MIRFFGISIICIGDSTCAFRNCLFSRSEAYCKSLPSRKAKIIYLLFELDLSTFPILLVIGCVMMIIGIVLFTFPERDIVSI